MKMNIATMLVVALLIPVGQASMLTDANPTTTTETAKATAAGDVEANPLSDRMWQELQRALPQQNLAIASNDACATAAELIVCATATAVPTVSCSKTAPLEAQCTGSVTVGGHGHSPVGAPGHVNWQGYGQCSILAGSKCSGTTSVARYDTESWPGGNTIGKGSQDTLSLGTVKVTNGCVSMSISAETDAFGYLDVGSQSITYVRAEATASDSEYRTKCTF